MLFKIPKLEWNTIYDGTTDKVLKTVTCTNSFIDYTIQHQDNNFYCFYGNGRYKEFKDLQDAKEWVEFTHYPAQVNKFLVQVPRQTILNHIDEIIDTVTDEHTHDNCVELKIGKMIGALYA